MVCFLVLIFWNQLLVLEVDQVVQNVEGSVEVVTQEVNQRVHVHEYVEPSRR